MSKKCIGIITFNRAINYGAILQCFALHKALNKLKINNEVIDYYSESREQMNTLKYRYKIGGIKKIVEFILIKRSKDIRNKKYQKFLHENVSVSKKIYYKENINDANKVYSNFLIGSDQVWNLKKNGYDKTYFLDFVKMKNKKNSYASSTGYNSDEDTKQMIGYLKDFNNISVRENGTKEVLEKKLNKNVDVMLDPTFLLTKNEWKKYMNYPKDKSYILLYTLTKSKKMRKFAHNLSRETGLPIKEISVRAEKYKGIKKISTAGIEEFLGYFNNAEYIITNSFHGLAFSIILEKEFFVTYHDNKSLGNDRLESLLNVFDLKERELDINKNLRDYGIIDYKKVRKIIEKERDRSFDYLSKLK